MWKRIPLLDNQKYVLNLCQDEKGRRFSVVTEIQTTASCMIRQTEELPVALLRSYDWKEISRRFRLRDGSGFVFGPHGEWFTHEEVEVLTRGDSAVPWITPCPPCLASR